jgi:uncharacterized protein
MSQINRRNFLKVSSIGAAGLAVTKANAKQPETGDKPTIVTRKLGKTGLELPIVSMGVMRADNPNLVKAALEAGVVHLDTAHVYQEGKNETMLGELLKDYDRDSFVISTKIILPKDWKKGNFKEEATPELFMETLETSLERLQMDYVDILYIHALQTKEAVQSDIVKKAFDMAKEKGYCKYLGVSTHSNEPEVIRAAIEAGYYDIVLTSYNYLQEHEQDMRKALEEANEAGLGIIAMKTMAGGFKDKEKTQPVNCKAALKWALQNEHVHTSIPGMINFDELEENMAVMADLDLSEDEKQDLASAATEKGLYCDGCRECTGQCTKGLPIPDMMRAYMYTYGYRDAYLGQKTIKALDLAENLCEDCDECTVFCRKGFDVAEKIKDVSRLKDIPTEFLT